MKILCQLLCSLAFLPTLLNANQACSPTFVSNLPHTDPTTQPSFVEFLPNGKFFALLDTALISNAGLVSIYGFTDKCCTIDPVAKATRAVPNASIMAISSKGCLVIADQTSKLFVFKVNSETGQLSQNPKIFDFNQNGSTTFFGIEDLAFSPDGHFLVVALASTQQIAIFRVCKCNLLQPTFFTSDLSPVSLAFSPKGTCLGVVYQVPDLVKNQPATNNVTVYEFNSCNGTIKNPQVNTTLDAPEKITFSAKENCFVVTNDPSSSGGAVFSVNKCCKPTLKQMITGGLFNGAAFSPDGCCLFLSEAIPSSIIRTFQVSGCCTLTEGNPVTTPIYPQSISVSKHCLLTTLFGGPNSGVQSYKLNCCNK